MINVFLQKEMGYRQIISSRLYSTFVKKLFTR